MKTDPITIPLASFSSCRSYRWWLKRDLDDNQKTILFIGLNPSKASSSIGDRTLTRLLNFSLGWGYGSLVVVNLFARVSFSPSIIKHCSDPIGKQNDNEISRHAFEWANNPLCDLWLGWGNHGAWQNRNLEVMHLLKRYAFDRTCRFPDAPGPLVLGLTKKGHPRHPLYISYKDVLRPFSLT